MGYYTSRMENRIKNFVKAQENLANKLGQALGVVEIQVKFEEWFPGCSYLNVPVNEKYQKMIYRAKKHVAYNQKRHRIKVVIYLKYYREIKTKHELKVMRQTVNKILCTNNKLFYMNGNNEIIVKYSKDPGKI